MNHENIVVETKGRVGVIRLNRPQALNALNAALVAELIAAIDAFEADTNIGCLLITGIGQGVRRRCRHQGDGGQDLSPTPTWQDFGGGKDRIARCRKPVVAAVAGFALGGGCEFAMQATSSSRRIRRSSASRRSSSASFRAIGGTQRLTRAVGKAKAMDLILTGRMMDAAEAERAGPGRARGAGGEPDGRGDEGRRDHRRHGLPSVCAAKEASTARSRSSLAEGVRFERRVFHALFATEDQKEGMAAFVEKRTPKFKNK